MAFPTAPKIFRKARQFFLAKASDIENDSTVPGGSVREALQDLLGGGGALVTSVFGRVGAVVATMGDYAASLISYSPSTPGDWDTPPTTVLEGLDELADRITTGIEDMSKDFYHEVQAGRVANTSDNTKYGYNDNIGNDIDADIWTGPDVSYGGFLTAAQTVTIQSTSAADDVGSTGAEEVTIHGLDANWVEQSETIATDGLVSVNSSNTYIRVNRMYIGTCGSNGTNDGTITCEYSGTVLAQVDPSTGQTLMAIYTVPDGKTAFVKDFSMGCNAPIGSTGTREGKGRFWFRLWNGSSHDGWRLQRQLELRNTGTGMIAITERIGMKFGPRTDIRCSLHSAQPNTSAYAEFPMILEATP